MIRTPASESAYEVVADKLRYKIQRMDDGQRLPTVRRLMADYDVGQSVVDKALTILRQEGLIVSRVGRGTFARPRSVKRVAQFDVILFDWDASLRAGSFHHLLVSHLGKCAGEQGQSIRVHNLGADQPYRKFEALVGEFACEAVFIDGVREPGLLEILDSRSVPYVVLFPNHVQPPPGSLQIDNLQAMSLVFDHLQSLGHQKIGYVHSYQEQATFYHDLWRRHELFYRLIAERGLCTRSEWVRYGHFETAPARETTKAILDACEEHPTAIIANDHVAQGVYLGLRDAGLRVGEDVSVVGFDDMPWSAYLDPPLTTVHTPIVEAAERGLEMMNSLLKGGKPGDPEFVPVSLVMRDSTGRCEV